MNPRFPILIPSKGRADSRITMRHLDALNVPYRVIVEGHEFETYAAVIDRARLVVLDPAYQRNYDACMDLAPGQSPGSGPARNMAWDIAEAEGHEYHWVVDDNIRGFLRYNHNLKVPVSDGTIFRCMEDFALRYKNVAMAGPHYFMFQSRKQLTTAPYVLNTRIFSCNLIRTNAPFRWRARYNEDLDLSLRILKSGWCTVLFNAFLQYKMTTQTIKGGNLAAFYAAEGTLPKSEMIVRLHPDVARLAQRWGRPHHFVDYRSFRQKLVRRDEAEIPEGIDDYGMRLVHLNKQECAIAEVDTSGA